MRGLTLGVRVEDSDILEANLLINKPTPLHQYGAHFIIQKTPNLPITPTLTLSKYLPLNAPCFIYTPKAVSIYTPLQSKQYHSYVVGLYKLNIQISKTVNEKILILFLPYYRNLIFNKSMFLDLVLDLFKTYIPIIMGIAYLYGYQKSKIQNLVKFFVLRTMLSMFEFILVNVFMLTFWIIHYSMIPIYIYLSIYSYGYACSAYDIIVAPLLHFFIDYHTDLITQVEREKTRLKVLEQHNKIKPGEIHETAFLTKFQRFVYTTFNIDNMYLLK